MSQNNTKKKEKGRGDVLMRSCTHVRSHNTLTCIWFSAGIPLCLFH